MRKNWIPACAGMTVLLPVAAHAHGFGRLYNLPVPFWLYAWGAAAALLVSFVIVGVFVAAPPPAEAAASRDLGNTRAVQVLRRLRFTAVLRALTVALLLLCLLTGFFGSRDPYRNFSMTTF